MGASGSELVARVGHRRPRSPHKSSALSLSSLPLVPFPFLPKFSYLGRLAESNTEAV